MAGRFTTQVTFEGVDRVSGVVAQINRRAGMLSERFSGLSQRAGAMGERLASLTGPMAGLAGAAGLGGLAASVKSFAGNADEMIKFSRQVGLSTEALQAWSHSAELSGVGADKFRASIKTFAKRLGEAKNGTGALNSSLKDTNPQLLAQLKAAGSTEEALKIYTQAMREAKSPAEQSAMAAAAFSKANAEMARFAASSAKDLAAQRAEQIKNGVITEEGAKASERFNDAMARIGSVLTGVSNSMMSDFMPAIANALEWVQGFIERNRELVKWVGIIGGGLAVAASSFAVVGFAVSQIVGPISFLASLFSGPVMGAIKLLSGGFGLIGGAIKAVSAILMANPIALVVAAIAGAVYLIYAHWGKIVSFFKQLWDDAAEIFKAFNPVKYITSALAKVTEFLFGFSLSGSGSNIINGLLTAFAIFNPVALITLALNKLSEYLFGFSLADAAKKLMASLSQPIQDKINAIVKWISDKIGGISKIVSGIGSVLGLGGDEENADTAPKQEKKSWLGGLFGAEDEQAPSEISPAQASAALPLQDRISQASKIESPLAQNVIAQAQATNTNVRSQIDVNIANAPPGTTVQATGDGAPNIRHHNADRGMSMAGALAP